MLQLVRPDRLVLPGDYAGQERHNKCDDCCPVIGCDTCGQCPSHPVTDGGIAERKGSPAVAESDPGSTTG